MNIFDLHNDFITGKKFGAARYLQTVSGQSVCGVVSAVWTTNKDEFQIWKLISKFKEFSEASENRKDSISTFLSFEDLHFVDTCNIHKLLMTKPVWCGLTWNLDNKLAGGAYGTEGLSATGEKVVKILESENVLVDTAHLNEKSFFDVARVSQKKLICSHTAFYDCLPHSRNIKDFQVRIILESGGVVGLALVNEFLSGRKHAELNDVVRHIEFFAQKFGSVNGLVIGTDFFGTKHLPKGIKSYLDLQKLASELFALGYSDEDVEKLFWKNASNLLFRS